ncbi:hypothetical protein [Veronia pacifica]|uniref:Uncharacterized protein n=1 Tax=Veronia pacifica TaxID=1080227 RepID=A0A1C3EBP3_9GAMM|nr:hypothetical protein [Veronia pacifica]ODA30662.1 hypothetical protein A8L45_19500 [Veronia pacifica]
MGKDKLKPEEYFDYLTRQLEDGMASLDTKRFESAIAKTETDAAEILSQIYLTLNFAKLISQSSEREEYLGIQSSKFDAATLSRAELDRLKYFEVKISAHELDLAIHNLPAEEKVKYYKDSIDIFDLEHRPGKYIDEPEGIEGVTPFNTESTRRSTRYRELYENIKHVEEKAINTIREKALRDPDYYGRLAAFSDKES